LKRVRRNLRSGFTIHQDNRDFSVSLRPVIKAAAQAGLFLRLKVE